MAVPFKLNILEKHHVSPSPHSTTPSSTSLPLTFLDIPWLLYPSNQTLFFFTKPPSKTAVIALLKQSLSVTLHHFHPLAGKLSALPPPAEPQIVYSKGDAVELTVAESNATVNQLSGSHPRSTAVLYSLLPNLPFPSTSRDTHVTVVIVPLLAVQITVFRDLGFSIGVTAQHVAADERTLDQFVKTWASICNSLVNKDSFFTIKSSPSFDRSVILDPNSLKTTFLKQWSNCLNDFDKDSDHETDQNNVRATFVLSSSDMNKIKHEILAKCKMTNEDPPLHLSPYVSACSYVWICVLKARETHDPKGDLCLGFNAGGITRLGYEVPTSYFGNCIAFGTCRALRSQLVGENGVVFAAKAIGKEIKRLDGDVLDCAERWICDWEELNIRVLGSPKVDSYEMDFGWGKVDKVEKISSDHHGRVDVISLCESRDLIGGIEIGVVLSKAEMNAFTSFFNNGLKELP